MAEKRLVSKSISISEKVNLLPDIFDMLLFTWLIPHSDDFGRLAGSPAKVKALVVPMLDKTLREVEESLGRLHEAKLIQWYEVNGDKFIQILNFEKHQSGLHKRTKPKFPEPPNDSGKFPEIPLEGKGIEGKGIGIEEKGKGREMPAPDSESLKDHLLNLINQMKVDGFTLYHLDIVCSYIGLADIEVIEAAIKKSQNKPVTYLINTLAGMITKDGITKKEHLPHAKVGEKDEKSQRQLRHEQSSPEDKPITGGRSGALPSKWADKVVQLPTVSG